MLSEFDIQSHNYYIHNSHINDSCSRVIISSSAIYKCIFYLSLVTLTIPQIVYNQSIFICIANRIINKQCYILNAMYHTHIYDLKS